MQRFLAAHLVSDGGSTNFVHSSVQEMNKLVFGYLTGFLNFKIGLNFKNGSSVSE